MMTEQQIKKAKATMAKNKAKWESQTIKVGKDWKIVRLDDMNWQIVPKGKKQPFDRFYFGTLLGALNALPSHMLDDEARGCVVDLVRIMLDIKEDIRKTLDRMEQPF